MVILPASSSGVMVFAFSTRTAISFWARIISTGPPILFFRPNWVWQWLMTSTTAKPRFSDGLLHQLVQQGGVVHRAPAHHGGPGGHRQFGNGKGVLQMAVKRGGGLRPIRRGGRILATGHAVDIVVDDDGRQVQVAPGGVDEVVAADGGGVAVPHDHDHLELGVGQLHPGGEGQGPAVGGVQGVEIHVDAHPPGAADAATPGRSRPW